jgi:hypothetical protein
MYVWYIFLVSYGFALFQKKIEKGKKYERIIIMINEKKRPIYIFICNFITKMLIVEIFAVLSKALPQQRPSQSEEKKLKRKKTCLFVICVYFSIHF